MVEKGEINYCYIYIKNTVICFLKKKEEAPYVLIWNIPQNVK